MIWHPTGSRTEKVPNLALRILPPADRQNAATAGANRYGKITQNIYPVSLGFGKDGAELNCRVRGDYAVCSDPDYLHESLAGYWATLEYRPNTNNKALQKVLFRGVVASESSQFSIQEDGVDVSFWDRLALSDDVVEMITGWYSIGTVLSMIDEMDIWPKDTNGNKVAGIDPDLFTRMQWCGMHSIDGIPIPQAFSQIFDRQKKDVPDIIYQTDGKMLLTTRKRGDEEVDLVVGRIKAAVGTKVYDVDIRELRGVTDYTRVVTRITGRGDLTRKADTYALEPAWDRSLDAAVLADPSLPDTNPVYRNVGRRYLVPSALWPYNAEGGTDGNFTPNLWARRTSLEEWTPIENDGAFEIDYGGYADPLTSRGTTGWSNGLNRYVRFNTTKITNYYTSSQLAARESGDFVTPTRSFPELQITAQYQDSVLSYDTGYRGDLPIRRRRILRNREYSKLTVGDFYRRKSNVVMGRDSVTPPTYDHTNNLINECEDAIEVTCKANQSFTAVLLRCNFNLKRGMRIRNIYDRDGDLIFEDVGWIIERINYVFNTGREGAYSTELQFDSAADDMLGGLVLQ